MAALRILRRGDPLRLGLENQDRLKDACQYGFQRDYGDYLALLPTGPVRPEPGHLERALGELRRRGTQRKRQTRIYYLGRRLGLIHVLQPEGVSTVTRWIR
jgi:hypothetical protein